MVKSERTPMSNTTIMKGADAFFGDDEAVEKQDSKPVKQQTSETVEQLDSKVVEQLNGKVEMVKVTYYITPEQDLKLDRIRLARRGRDRNKRVDKSALIREAIEAMEE